MNLFDYLNDINFDKTNIISKSDNPELAEKLYQPFVVNRFLSYSVDCIKIANEVNQRPHCDKKLQFDFLLNTIRKKKRFSKWEKKVDDEKLELIMKHYNYSYAKANQVVSLFTDEQITLIKNKYNAGGLDDNKPKLNGRSATRK